MQFHFTDEQQQFRDIVQRFCRDHGATATTRKLIESDRGYDPAVWKRLCQELGLCGIHIPESRGGAGFGAVELGIVMEEFGRALLPSPYLSCAVLACSAAAEIDDAARRDAVLGPMISGEKLGTLLMNPASSHPVSTISGSATLSGSVKGVLQGVGADYLLLLTPTAAGAALHLLDGRARGVTISPLTAMDGTRRLAAVTLDDVEANVVAELDADQLRRLYDTALVALSNEMSGGAQALLAAAVEYTKLRVQFGRSIGSFQAIKHRLADLHVDVELAKVAAWQAAQALDSDEEASANASLAKFTTADTYVKSALECIQLHGGIGFTWENDTHLWYRRAKSSEVLLGTPALHRERMIEELCP